MCHAKKDMNSYSEKRQQFRQILFQNFLPLRVEKLKVFRITLLFATLAIFNLTIIPANAVANGKYNCNTGVLDDTLSTNFFKVSSRVITRPSDSTYTECEGEVNIPSGITGIGNQAFDFAERITSVNIPNTVTEIASNAFDYTPLLQNFNVHVDNGTFSSVDGVLFKKVGGIRTILYRYPDGKTGSSGSYEIPSSVTTIGEGAFKRSVLTSVTIPSGVTNIGVRAFELAVSLQTVTFGENSQLTVIGNWAFSDNHSLTSISIPSRVTRIEPKTFLNASVLRSISIPSSVTFIGDSAFENALLLRAVNFGENSQLSIIDDWAFWNTGSLTSISMPAGVDTIGQGAFAGVSESQRRLSSLIFLGDAPRNLEADIFQSATIGARAYVPANATRFPANGQDWNGLIVSRDTPPSDEDSDDSPPSGGGTDSPTFTPSVNASTAKVKSVDASFKLTNRKYLAKFEIKNALTKDRSFKSKPTDKYKYSISKASKKNCAMRGNYFMKLKEGGVCEITVTRTSNKGVKSKYQVKINYNN
jgi:hypothetical protein